MKETVGKVENNTVYKNIESVKSINDKREELEIDKLPSPEEFIETWNETSWCTTTNFYEPLKKVTIKFKKLDSDAIIPSYKSEFASGFDLSSIEDKLIKPFEVVNIKTGLSIEIGRKDLELQIRPRSGLGKIGLTVINTPGTVDNDYRGEICVLLIKLTPGDYQINKGDRIAQGVIMPVINAPYVTIIESKDLSETNRGSGGFGSTGKN